MDSRLKMDNFSSVGVCWTESQDLVAFRPRGPRKRLCSPLLFPFQCDTLCLHFPPNSASFLWCMAEAHHEDRSVGYVKVVPSHNYGSGRRCRTLESRLPWILEVFMLIIYCIYDDMYISLLLFWPYMYTTSLQNFMSLHTLRYSALVWPKWEHLVFYQ